MDEGKPPPGESRQKAKKSTTIGQSSIVNHQFPLQFPVAGAEEASTFLTPAGRE
jgi:hypothetical protein